MSIVGENLPWEGGKGQLPSHIFPEYLRWDIQRTNLRDTYPTISEGLKLCTHPYANSPSGISPFLLLNSEKKH